MSDSNRTHTTSGAHQGYIERPGATEKVDPRIAEDIASAPAPGIEDGLLADGFTYPERVVDSGRASFGTLGNTKSERKEFWNEIERTSGKSARVQNRIIAELPVELGLRDRCRVARDFCLGFEERGLAYWATLHAPGKRNDDRNYHLHITYFDRPTGRDERGRWSHAVTEKHRKKSRHIVEKMPYRSNKHPDTRKRDWPKGLRRSYADTCNFHLSIADLGKRYDPRSYKESGITKEPTEHLGNKVSALEAMGLDTVGGQRNAKKEIRWKVSKAEQPWMDRIEALRNCEGFGQESLALQQADLIETASKGITHARKSASFAIVSELMTVRAESRSTFLDAEISRLERADDMSDLARRNAAIIALSAEREMLAMRGPQIENTAKKCRETGLIETEKNMDKIQKFDKGMKTFDPNIVFDEGQSNLGDIDEFASPSEAPEPRAEPDFDATDLRNIEELFGIETLPEKIAAEPTKTTTDPHGADPKDATSEAPDVKEQTPFLRVEEILSRMAAGDDKDAPQEASPDTVFPGAWAIRPTTNREQLADLDQRLGEMDNRSLRNAAIASRDAADLSSDDAGRKDFGRGWAVLRFEAGRRGLDLDTGIHRPEEASDQERARLHTDQDPSPIRIVRKNIARQRVRG